MENFENKAISAFLESKLKKILEIDESYDELKKQLKEKCTISIEMLEKENELELKETLEKMSNLNIKKTKLDNDNLLKEAKETDDKENQILKKLQNVQIKMETVQENLRIFNEVIIENRGKEVEIMLEEYENQIRKLQTEPIKYSKQIRSSKFKIEDLKNNITAAETETLEIRDKTCELTMKQEFYRVQIERNQQMINEKKSYLSGFNAVRDQHYSVRANIDRLRMKLETNRATLDSQEEEKFAINQKIESRLIEIQKAQEKRSKTESEKSRLLEDAMKLEVDLEAIINLEVINIDDLLDNPLIDCYCPGDKMEHFRNESKKQRSDALNLLDEADKQEKIYQNLKDKTDEMRNSRIQEESKIRDVEIETDTLKKILDEKKQLLEEKQRNDKNEMDAKLKEISDQQLCNKKLLSSIAHIDAKAKMLASQFQKDFVPLSNKNQKLKDAIEDLRKVRLSVSSSKSKTNETFDDRNFLESTRVDDSFATDYSFLNCTVSTIGGSEK